MKHLLFITLLLLLFFTGCKKETLKLEKVEVDASNVVIAPVSTKPGGILELQAIADSVRFIKLDNTDDALTGSIAYVHFIDSLMFVQDRKGRSVLVFDTDGKFKYKISKQGGGPGEYNSILRFMVDDVRKRLMIYDANLRKMIFYNFQGEYLKEINRFSNGRIVRDVINLPDGNFLCYRDDFEEIDIANVIYGLWETDSLGTPIKHLLKYEIMYPHHSHSTFSLYQLPDNKIGLMASENEIYHYENGTLKKFITYKPDGISILDFPGRYKTNEKYNYMYSTSEKNKYVLTEWHNEELIPYFSLYSCTDKTITTFGTIDFEFAEFAFIGYITDSNLTNALLVETPGIMISQLLHEKDNLVSAGVKSRIKALTAGMSDEEIEDMNPVLEIVYLKQNGEIPDRYKHP